MRFSSALAFLSISAIASAAKLRSAYNGLCLDATEGLSNGAVLAMGPCDALKYGSWTIQKSEEYLQIVNDHDRTANDGYGWCLDFDSKRNKHPTLWQCNSSPQQWFIPETAARRGRWSFKTSYEVDHWGAYELSGDSSNNKWGQLANFRPVSATTRTKSGANYEWNYIH
ncbi:hypothetical protein BGX27_009342 [Mortierella sp. AM989]|nr:hypothetical protein BGX27_009342 [Mortierella sp. AM989]